MPVIKSFVILLLLCTGLHGAAQPVFKTFPLLDDNRPFKINCLSKGPEGYIYTGTTNGLYIFDGIAFRKIKIAGTDSRDTVTAVFHDNKHQLWAGFKNGRIAKRVNGILEFVNPEEGLPKVAITAFIQDLNGNIWFATNGEGIYYFYNSHLYLINEEEGMSDKYVHALSLAANGDVLAATDQGINICTVTGTKKTVKTIGPKNGLPDYYITAISPAGHDKFWVGTQEKGFCLYDHAAQNITIPPAAQNWDAGQVNAVICTGNNCWIATAEKGLLRLPAFNAAIETVAATGNNTGNLLQDNEGNIWMNNSTALLATAADKIQVLPLYNAAIYETIHTILCDHQGNIWAGTDGGLIKFDRQKNSSKNYPVKGLTAATDITGLYQDVYHNIWISTMGEGVFVMDPFTGRYRNISENPLLKKASVLSVTGNGNTVCMGGLEGVATIFELSAANSTIDAPYSYTNYNNIPNIGNNYIHTVYKDYYGRIWFGTDGKGVTVLQKGRFSSFNKSNGINDNIVYSFAEDKKGNIWFNTKDAGVYCYDGRKFRNYNLSSGISDLKISSIQADKQGNIIIINEKGVDILNPVTGTVSYLDNVQGITDINTAIESSTKDTAGNILICTAAGIAVYAPANNTELKPRTILDEVLLFLKPVTGGTVFASDENSFTFNFTGLYYSNPDKVRYQYRLDGLDSSWVTTRDRSVPFPNLRPGKYTFHVRSSLNDNFENASEAIYSFTITLPLWKRSWFIALCVLAVAGLLYLYIKYREKEIRKMQLLQQEKVQFQFQVLGNQVNPHFLFNSFNTLISAIEEDPKSAVDYVEHLSEFFRNIVNYRDKDIISLGEEISLLSNYYYLQQKRYGSSLQLSIHIPADIKTKWMVPPLTLQLLMENAIKHNAVSKETVLNVDVCTENGSRLVIRNNINPKISPQPGTGMGLQNIVNRYKLLSRDAVAIHNENGYFTVSLPALKND
ncbi:MAG: two-component regulator propeller domain-containing protein [Ferruginibacter sp.]